MVRNGDCFFNRWFDDCQGISVGVVFIMIGSGGGGGGQDDIWVC